MEVFAIERNNHKTPSVPQESDMRITEFASQLNILAGGSIRCVVLREDVVHGQVA